MNKKILISSILLLLIIIIIISTGVIYYVILGEKEYHVHADFLVSINGETLNFSKSQFQSTATQPLAKHVHLHDGWGDVIHYHERGITLRDFFTSFGMNISQDCFSTLNNSYCSNQTHDFEVYVNNKSIENPQDYIANDLDQIVIIYHENNESIDSILSNVTDKACIQSALCPSRGTPTEGSCVSGESCAVDISQYE